MKDDSSEKRRAALEAEKSWKEHPEDNEDRAD